MAVDPFPWAGQITLVPGPFNPEQELPAGSFVVNGVPFPFTGARLTDYLMETVADNVSAAGNMQANAPVLPAQMNIVTIVGIGMGVQLQSASIFDTGRIMVFNRGGNPLLVYPAPGESIEDLAANQPVQVYQNVGADFVRANGSRWVMK